MNQINKIRDERGEIIINTNEIENQMNRWISKIHQKEKEILGLVKNFQQSERIHTKNSVDFLYANGKHTEKGVREMTQLMISSQTINMWEYTLSEKEQISMTQTLRQWKNLKVQCPPNQNSQGYSLQILKRILKCTWK